MTNKILPIGVFDSGVGGLTVVKEILKLLPRENIVYLGDTARVPYGTKSTETIVKYAFEDAMFLLRNHAKIVVIACNTASSAAAGFLEEKLYVPVIGVIEAGAKAAVKKTKNGKIGVIGTEATISSRSYEQELWNIEKSLQIFSKSCPLFVPLAEEGMIEHPATKMIAEEYLKELKDEGIDTLILGCTHYPLLKPVLQEIMGDNVELIDSGSVVSAEIEKIMREKEIANDISKHGELFFYVTDYIHKFDKIVKNFLQVEVDIHLSKINLEKEFNQIDKFLIQEGEKK